MGRFDYIRYDETRAECQKILKDRFEMIEKIIGDMLPEGRARSLALTHLEESYMWTGKGLRDAQIAVGGPAHLQEDRDPIARAADSTPTGPTTP